MRSVNVLMVGDISGEAGMGALFLSLSSLVKKTGADFVVVNGENASGGFGLTVDDYMKIRSYGADVVTSGNHIWQKSEILPQLEGDSILLRPLNYPRGVPGHGVCTVTKNGVRYAVINAQGRTDLVIADDPFTACRGEAEKLRKQGYIVLVDFHAENAQEKEALGFYLDGIASLVAGTHTHVQTMDEKILPGGTGYITDLGMTGVQHQVIGSRSDVAIRRQLTQVPYKSEVAEGRGEIRGVLASIDAASGKTLSISRI